MLKPDYYWYEDTGTAICGINGGEGNIFRGTAHCCPSDEEFKSERIGCYIAETRALINMYNYKLYYEAIPAYKALKHLKNSFEQSYRYNPDSYEARVMRKEYYGAEDEVNMYRTLIKATKKELALYFEERNKYQEKA